MKKIRIRKILGYGVIPALLLLAAITIAPTLFYRQEKNRTPLPPYYQKGIYHMHSTFSDGAGNIDQITKAAASLGIDFVILTDHGRPNIQCAEATGFYNNVLLIGGSEFSLNCGHLAALGFQVPDYIFPPEPQEAIDEVTADKGVCFISHPFDRTAWTDWETENFTGIELMSLSSYAGKLGVGQFLRFLLQYPFNSKYALLKTLAYPRQNIKKWSSLHIGGKYYGIYALDAHARLEVTEKFWLNFPSYRALGQILTVYVKSGQRLGPQKGPGKTRTNDPKKAAAEIISALRRGNFFNVIEAIAPANGFEARFIGENGEKVEMGGSTKSRRGRIEIELPFSFDTEIIIKKDGSAYKKIRTEKSEYRISNIEHRISKDAGSAPREKQAGSKIEIVEPGVYYLEVYVVKNRFSKLPWILTNPFFIGVNYPVGESKIKQKFCGGPGGSFSKAPPGRRRQTNEIAIKKLLVDEKDFFTAEPSSLSKSSIGYEILKKEAGAGDQTGTELVTKLDFELRREPGKKDFWVSLARRQDFDFSGYSGMVFDARSSKKMRFWLELRTKKNHSERWYSHSFLTHREWKRFYIPFDRFHIVYGKRETPDLSKIYSIYFTINNALAYSGAAGTLELKNIGLY